jgi:hypothetical protein
MIDPDTRLEPLPVAVGQGHGGDRQIEDLTGHARDPVERLAGRRIEQIEAMQSIEASRFMSVGHKVSAANRRG